MARRSMIWPLVAALYSVINIGGAAYALVMGEIPHAALHVALMLVGVVVWYAFGPPSGARRIAIAGGLPGEDPALTDRFRNLEQSLDAVAIEVDRISEGQREMTDLLADTAPGADRPNSRRDSTRGGAGS